MQSKENGREERERESGSGEKRKKVG